LISCVLVSYAPAAKRSIGESLAELHSTIISRYVTMRMASITMTRTVFQVVWRRAKVSGRGQKREVDRRVSTSFLSGMKS
jgi:hypothetical protein